MRKVLLFATLIVLVLLLASCMKPAFAVLNLEANNTTLAAGAEVELSWELNTPEELVSVDYVLHIDDITIEPTETSYATVLASGDHDVYVEATYVTKSKLGFTKKPAIVESDHLLIKVSLPAGELSINVPETVQSGDPVDVNWTLSIPASYESVTYEVYVDGEIAETTTETKYSTVLEEGQHDIYVKASVAFANGEEIEITSETKTVSVVANTVVFLTETTEYGPGAVTIEWEPTDGLTHTYQYSLNGGEIIETTATSVTFEDLPDGTYTLSVKPAETTGYPSEFTFSVDLTGPLPTIYGSDRTAANLPDGDIKPYGRYAYIEWMFNEPVSAVSICFRELTDDYSWPFLTDWIPWDPNVSGILVNDELVTLYTPEGISYLDHIFEVGHTYLIYVSGYDKFGNWGYSYMTFTLDERYDNSDKPEIYYVPTTVTPASDDASGTMEIYIVAPNVRDYASENVHDYYAPDASKDADLMYIQTTLSFDENLEVDNVVFPDFMDDKKDLSGFVANPGEITLCRGFVDGEDESDEQDDVLAIVTLKFGTEMNGTSPVIGIEDNYVIKDSNNRVIDGIVVDNFGYPVDIPAPEEAGM